MGGGFVWVRIRRLTGAAVIRCLLVSLLAVALFAGQARAQDVIIVRPPPPPGGSDSGSNNRFLPYIIGGIIVGVISILIVDRINADNKPPPPPDQPPPPPPPDGPALTQLQSPRLPPRSGPPVTNLRPGFHLPPPGVTQYVPNEVMLDIPATVSVATLDAIAFSHGMTRLETVRIGLTRRTLHRWRIDRGGSVPEMIIALSRDKRFAGQIAGAQAIHLYELSQAGTLNVDQYAPTKLNIPSAHRLATGNEIIVAVIDSAVDGDHPDLAEAIVQNFNAAGDAAQPHPHGTGMAGAIAGRRTLLSVAPRVRLVTVQAFSPKANTADGTTFNILKGLDWAVARGARVINMSFAGPPDPRLRDALQAAANRGVVLIAAAGNAGPNSPPLYPAADPNVIAVTATDANDAIFARAVRGNHISVAAPGVDIIVPAPSGAYQFTTGTSVAAAAVSGVVALVIERNPWLPAKEIRAILMRTARDLGPTGRDRDYGAGLVDALGAVNAASSRTH